MDRWATNNIRAFNAMDSAFQQRVLFIAKVLLALGAVIAVIFLGARVFLLVFAGLLFAVFLKSMSDPLAEHAHVRPGWSLLAVLVLLTGTLAAAGYFAAPSISEQVDALMQKLPQSVQQLQKELESYSWGRALLDQAETGQILGKPRPVLEGVGGVFSSLLGWLVNLVIILFIGLYVAAEPGIYRHGFLLLAPKSRQDRYSQVVSEVHETLKWWLVGKFFSMGVIGVSTAAGLWLLGVPLSLVLGLIAALLTFIPNIGPIISAIPAILLGWTIGPEKALHVAALYVGIQTAESYVLTPLVQRKTVELPPALILSAQVLLGTMFGILGVALATPLTAASLVITKMLYVEDRLHKQLEEPDDAP